MRTGATLSVLAAMGAAAPFNPAAASSYGVVYSFLGGPADGAHPQAGLIEAEGTLYGTTPEGGAGLFGTVFSINPKTGAEAVFYAFKGASGGSQPASTLNEVTGTLFGTTISGGSSGQGTVFSVVEKTGAETVLYPFKAGNDGSAPTAGLIDYKGTLYGTTPSGGAGDCHSGCGTVFSVNPKTGSQTVLHAFTADGDGAEPDAGLINVGGELYGTTTYGGANNLGAVFSLNPKTGAETVVYSFKSGTGDGSYPSARLLNVGGTLYGTTAGGGTAGVGTVFSFTANNGAETVVYSFQGGDDGALPEAGLMNVGSILYGTTINGGAGCLGCGTVFSIDTATGAETVLHSFTDQDGDGAAPQTSLVAVHGVLYGTTISGGSAGYGTVFSYTP